MSSLSTELTCFRFFLSVKETNYGSHFIQPKTWMRNNCQEIKNNTLQWFKTNFENFVPIDKSCVPIVNMQYSTVTISLTTKYTF